jgi:UDP-GlcNAc:undecaprenyl-phosphate GlcNAc-1-phosphate transferase
MFFGAAFLIAVFLTPLVIRFALSKSWVDLPSNRKIHQIPVPRLGGVAIFFALWCTWGTFAYLYPNMIPLESVRPMRGLFLGSLLIFCLGIFDDIVGADAKKKLLVQTLAAVLVVFFDVGVDIVFNPFSGGDLLISHPWVGKFITVAWIVVVTNAINLIDGLDGLAGGVSLITSITICFISKDLGIPHLPYFSLCMAGACLGFLVFNFSPARIFLGDSGSLVLGFILAVASIMGAVKRSTAVVMLGPPIVLALPMADTLMAIARRFLRTAAAQGDLSGYKSFLSPPNFAKRIREIFEADQNHIHHALVRVGLSHRKAVMILYVVTGILGVTAYRIAVYNYIFSSMIVLGTLSAILLLFSRSVKP